MSSTIYHLPRLYLDLDLVPGEHVALDVAPTHYLKNVLRREAGDQVRVFNGRTGEFLARLDVGRKKDSLTLQVDDLIRDAPPETARMQVIFTPLKKDAQDFLIEKAVELGATDFYPITTDQADVRAINPTRVQAQINEAAEQCASLIIPRLHPLTSFKNFLGTWDQGHMILAAIERVDAPLFRSLPRAVYARGGARTILVGPAGGFSTAEKHLLLTQPFVQPINLGDRILRAETAVIAMLAALHLKGENNDV